jgi:uncharacterized protein YdeI (YjbR/CyaY-like superfamily)
MDAAVGAGGASAVMPRQREGSANRSPMTRPEELEMLLDADAALRGAWERLTPGRRRGWLLHFIGAKQSKTRLARIKRATPRILEGFGMHD